MSSLTMFNAENFDLEFEDDFSTNIFSEKLKRENLTFINKEKTEESKANNIKELPGGEVETLKRQAELNEVGSSESQSKKLKNHANDILDFSFNDSPKNNSIFFNESKKWRKWNHDGSVQRKFPGPAGLLPDKPFKGHEDFSIMKHDSFEEDIEKDKNQQVIYSQSSASLFLESAFQRLVADFDLNKKENLLHKHTVEWIKKTALNKALNGRKVPFLGVVLHSINHDSPDPVLLLKDPTGEIHGTLHRDVWADLGNKLQAGIALALRQVGVLITGVIRRQIYLNITTNNVLAIYGCGENGHEVEVTTVNKVSKADLLKSVQEWKRQNSRNVTPSPLFDSPSEGLFSTISSLPKKEIINLKCNLPFHADSKAKNFNRKESASIENKKEETRRGEHAQLFPDFEIELTEIDFSDELIVPHNKSAEGEKLESDPIIALGSNANSNFSTKNDHGRSAGSPRLSQAETSILDEVLSGIDLKEFEE